MVCDNIGQFLIQVWVSFVPALKVEHGFGLGSDGAHRMGWTDVTFGLTLQCLDLG